MTKELKVFLWIVLLGVSLTVVLKYLFPLMAPFLLGIVFAALIEPVVRKLGQSLKIGRKLAVILVLAILVLAIFFITGLSLITFYLEAQRLIPRIPELVNRLLGFIQGWLGYLSRHFPQVNENFNNLPLLTQSFDRIFRALISGTINFLPRFPQVLVAIGLGGVTAYFFSRDKNLISQAFYRILPKGWQKNIVEVKTEVIFSVARFIRVECTLALITTILTTITFYFLGTHGALAYGFLGGVLDFLPVLGPGLIYFPLAVISLLFNDYHRALWLIGAYFLILMVRQVIEFKLIGENLNLHPLLSILAIYIGWNVFGFAGIFFGPLLTIILRACYRMLVKIN